MLIEVVYTVILVMLPSQRVYAYRAECNFRNISRTVCNELTERMSEKAVMRLLGSRFILIYFEQRGELPPLPQHLCLANLPPPAERLHISVTT